MKIPSSVSSLERISNFILKTPLIKSERLSSPAQNVYLKLENIRKQALLKPGCTK